MLAARRPESCGQTYRRTQDTLKVEKCTPRGLAHLLFYWASGMSRSHQQARMDLGMFEHARLTIEKDAEGRWCHVGLDFQRCTRGLNVRHNLSSQRAIE
jgi:hypothetical protein